VRKIRVIFIIPAILGLVFLALPTSAEQSGATLSLSPSADNFSVGSEFEVSLVLDTAGQAINIVDIIVYFPEDLIEVTGLPTRDGLLPLWQFNYSNEKGEINIVGGERQSGIAAANSEITRIRFKVKKEGKAILKISSKNSKIILADGLGTKMPVKAGEAYYSLTIAPVAIETPKAKTAEPVSEVPKLELKALALGLIRWTPSLTAKIPIVPILKINFAGLLVALTAVIYSVRKKK
jgi:hypothetical protein